MIFCCYNYYIYMFLFFGKEVMNNGGGYSEYILVGCVHQKRGGGS